MGGGDVAATAVAPGARGGFGVADDSALAPAIRRLLPPFPASLQSGKSRRTQLGRGRVGRRELGKKGAHEAGNDVPLAAPPPRPPSPSLVSLSLSL